MRETLTLPTSLLRSQLLRRAWRAGLGWYARITWQRRYNQLALERVEGRPFLVLQQVFNPKLLRTGALMAHALERGLLDGAGRVLDMGTGSGVGAVFAALHGARVVATDINSEAVRCARINALLNRVDERVDVRGGDLFAPVAGERFDAVLFNPPFFCGAPRDALDRAWRSDDVVARFAAGLADHLAPGGQAFVLLSSDADEPALLALFSTRGYTIQVAFRRDLVNEIVTIYAIRPISREREPREDAHPV